METFPGTLMAQVRDTYQRICEDPKNGYWKLRLASRSDIPEKKIQQGKGLRILKDRNIK